MAPKYFKKIEQTDYYKKRHQEISSKLSSESIDLFNVHFWGFNDEIDELKQKKTELDKMVKGSDEWKSMFWYEYVPDRKSLKMSYIDQLDDFYFSDPSAYENLYRELISEKEYIAQNGSIMEKYYAKQEIERLRGFLERQKNVNQRVDQKIAQIAEKNPGLPAELVKNYFLMTQKKVYDGFAALDISISKSDYLDWIRSRKNQDESLRSEVGTDTESRIMKNRYHYFDKTESLIYSEYEKEVNRQSEEKIEDEISSVIEKEYLTSLITKKVSDKPYLMTEPRFSPGFSFDRSQKKYFERFIDKYWPEGKEVIETPYKLMPGSDLKQYWKSVLTYKMDLSSGPDPEKARRELSESISRQYEQLPQKEKTFDSPEKFASALLHYIGYMQESHRASVLAYVPTLGLHKDAVIDTELVNSDAYKKDYRKNFIEDAEKLEKELEKLIGQSELLKRSVNVPRPLRLEDTNGDVYAAYEKNEAEFSKQLISYSAFVDDADRIEAEAERVSKGSRFFTKDDISRWVKAKRYEGLCRLRDVVDPDHVNHEDPDEPFYTANMLRAAFSQRYRHAYLLDDSIARVRSIFEENETDLSAESPLQIMQSLDKDFDDFIHVPEEQEEFIAWAERHRKYLIAIVIPQEEERRELVNAINQYAGERLAAISDPLRESNENDLKKAYETALEIYLHPELAPRRPEILPEEAKEPEKQEELIEIGNKIPEAGNEAASEDGKALLAESLKELPAALENDNDFSAIKKLLDELAGPAPKGNLLSKIGMSYGLLEEYQKGLDGKMTGEPDAELEAGYSRVVRLMTALDNMELEAKHIAQPQQGGPKQLTVLGGRTPQESMQGLLLYSEQNLKSMKRTDELDEKSLKAELASIAVCRRNLDALAAGKNVVIENYDRDVQALLQNDDLMNLIANNNRVRASLNSMGSPDWFANLSDAVNSFIKKPEKPQIVIEDELQQGKPEKSFEMKK